MSPDRRRLGLGAAALAALPSTALAARPVPGDPMRFYVRGRFGQIHGRRSEPSGGSARTPLLCFHPSPMSSLVFGDFVPVMGTDRLTVALDTPGYGYSDRPPTQPSISDFAAAMGDAMDGLGLKQVDLFGYHTGCATALELARQRPAQVRRVILNSALMFSPEDYAPYRASFAKRAAQTLTDQVNEIPQRWAQHRRFWRDVPSDERAWPMFWESNRDLLHAHWGFVAAFAFDFPAALKALDKPLLIFNPEDDLHGITPRAAPLMRHGRIHDLPGWTHGFLNAHPQEIAALARAFLDG